MGVAVAAGACGGVRKAVGVAVAAGARGAVRRADLTSTQHCQHCLTKQDLKNP